MGNQTNIFVAFNLAEREEEKERRKGEIVSQFVHGKRAKERSIVTSIALGYCICSKPITTPPSERASFRVHPRAGMCRERVPSWLAERNVTLQSLPPPLLPVPRPDPRYRSARFHPIISTSFVPFRSNSKPQQQPTREPFAKTFAMKPIVAATTDPEIPSSSTDIILNTF